MNTVPWHGSEISCGAQSSLSNFLLSLNFCYLTSYLLLSQLYFVTPRTFLQFHVCTNASSHLPPFMASLSFSYITAVGMFSKTVTTFFTCPSPTSSLAPCSHAPSLVPCLSCTISHTISHVLSLMSCPISVSFFFFCSFLLIASVALSLPSSHACLLHCLLYPVHM